MKRKDITLRCDCGLEAVVFSRFDYEHEETCYDISIEDSYLGGGYKGLFGRFKRAWKAFIAKPVYYSSIFCEDKEKMKKFLTDSLALIDNVDGVDDNCFIQGLYTEEDAND